MNKPALIEALVERTGLPRKAIEQVLISIEAVIIETLQRGEEVNLTGFGKFIAKVRHARIGVDPRNPNERIQMPTVTVPKFRAGKTFKDSLNNK
ncbi:MAG: HU family DNA-binding protein [Candidatus Kerfeldbacteria bacterium]|nr:HU family DNA-binding protein [Candidatus Kerfeldbacteria bacterium]